MVHPASRRAACRASAEAKLARKPVFDVCMLCDECPCSCKKATKKAAPKRAAKKAPSPTPVVEEAPEDVSPVVPVTPAPDEPTPAPRPSPLAAMRAAAGRARPVTPRVPDPAPITKIMSGHAPSSDDHVMDDAIRALAPLLHPAEKRTHAKVLCANSSMAQRAAAWQHRRREALDGYSG